MNALYWMFASHLEEILRLQQFTKLPIRTFVLAVCLAAATFPFSGCFTRHAQKQPHVKVNAIIKSASLDQLVTQVNDDAARIQSLNATVDIATDVSSSENKEEVKEYTEIRGYVLVRKPQMIRMIGLAPIVRNRIFDMVSDGNTFSLSLPTRNKYFAGSNEIKVTSKNTFENIRPQHILDAVLVNSINPRDDIAVLEVGVDQVTDPITNQVINEQDYILNIIHRDLDGVWTLQRKVYFSRSDLRVHKQVIFNKDGSIATSAAYEDFKEFDGIQFPSIIRIQRPQEGYTIQLASVTLKINSELGNEKFELTQPAGSQLINVDEPQPDEVKAVLPETPVTKKTPDPKKKK